MLQRFSFLFLLTTLSFVGLHWPSFGQDLGAEALLNLNNSDPYIRQQTLSELPSFDWRSTPALRQKVFKLQHDGKQPAYVRKQAIMLMDTFHWHDDQEAIASLAKLLGEPEYRELALRFFTSQLPLHAPRAMQAFSDAYLGLSDHERLQLIHDHSDLLAKLHHPYAEAVVLKDLERLLIKYQNPLNDLGAVIDDLADSMNTDAERMSFKYHHDPRFFKIIELLNKKLEHPIARSVSYEFLKTFYFVKKPLYIDQMPRQQLWELLRYPDLSSQLSLELRTILSWRDPSHPLYNQILDLLDMPKLRGDLKLDEFIRFIKRSVPMGKLAPQQAALLGTRLRGLEFQLSVLQDRAFINMRADLRAMVERWPSALSLEAFSQKHAGLFGHRSFETPQALLDFLYGYYQQFPDLSAQVVRLETIARYHELYPGRLQGTEHRDQFIASIEQSLNPRQELTRLRIPAGPEHPQLSSLLQTLRSEGTLVFDGPSSAMTRSSELRKCMIKAMNRDHY